MKWAAAAVLALLARGATATTAYVSDELILGVYSEENNQGQRLATLHSGASVESLSQRGDFTEVRLNDGTLGWVKSAYLTSKEPATVRVKLLEEELDRSRSTLPAAAPARPAAAPAEQQARAATAAQGVAPLWVTAIAVALAAALGYWLGYAALARRVRNKFGGIKVY